VLGEDGLHEAVAGRGERVRRGVLVLRVRVRFVRVMGGVIVPLVRGEIVAPDYEAGVDHISEVRRVHTSCCAAKGVQEKLYQQSEPVGAMA